jgi:hypothetical protein
MVVTSTRQCSPLYGESAANAQTEKQKDLHAVVEALYWVRDSNKVTRLIKALTPNERLELWRKVRERVDSDKAHFSELFEKVAGKKQR